MIEIRKDPSERELKWFGLIAGLFFGLIGTLALFRFGSPFFAYTAWALGTVFVLVYYLAPPLRKPMFLGWMYAVFPIGWTISHILLAVVYYFVLTPIGLALRLFGKDPIQRRTDERAESYWIEHDPAKEADRYFRQF